MARDIFWGHRNGIHCGLRAGKAGSKGCKGMAEKPPMKMVILGLWDDL